MWLRVDEIRLHDRRARGACPRTVERYRESLESGREPPAIRVSRSPNDTWLVRDGRHRLLAARAAGHVFIEAHVE